MNVSSTKGNLLAAQRSLKLAEMGYDLLDRKRSILMREILARRETCGQFREQLSAVYQKAYAALIEANLSLGQNVVRQVGVLVPEDDRLTVLTRSVMGVPVSDCRLNAPDALLPYGTQNTNVLLDDAMAAFLEAKALTVRAAAEESSLLRMADAMEQAKIRANALKNVVIPELRARILRISSDLEEKERDETTTLRVIKKAKQKNAQA